MANPRHLKLLKKGAAIWNTWRAQHPEIPPHLGGANLSRANLGGFNLSKANLSVANLYGANLVGTHLSGAAMRSASLSAILNTYFPAASTFPGTSTGPLNSNFVSLLDSSAINGVSMAVTSAIEAPSHNALNLIFIFFFSFLSN